MARRVFFHVGLPKTGTSFLQGVLWSNRAELRNQGVLVPATLRHHYRAAKYVRGDWKNRPRAEAIEADWERLLEIARRSRRDVLITSETLSAATAKQVQVAIDAFAGAETHVVITARDLARQLPAEWQQSVKQGSAHTLNAYMDDVMSHGPRARWFWRVQDLPSVAARWGAELPSSRVHLVTVPPKGSDPAQLWSRFASVLDIDPTAITLDSTPRNESLGRIEVELLRQANEARGDRFPRRGSHRWFRGLLANRILAERAGKEKFALDASTHEWIRARSRDTVSTLAQRGYDIVGDLEELVPPDEAEPGLNPSAAAASELLPAAMETIVDLMDAHRGAVLRYERLNKLSESRQHKVR